MFGDGVNVRLEEVKSKNGKKYILCRSWYENTKSKNMCGEHKEEKIQLDNMSSFMKKLFEPKMMKVSDFDRDKAFSKAEKQAYDNM